MAKREDEDEEEEEDEERNKSESHGGTGWLRINNEGIIDIKGLEEGEE